MGEIKVIIKRNNQNQEFYYDGDLNIPVTTLLERINGQEKILDINGNEVDPIEWSCSCLQGLCGSCAMVINSTPKLACKTFVNKEEITKEFNYITIEPLTKFKLIKDLKVDKSKLHNAMLNTSQWLESSAIVNKDDIDFEYELSSCLMCGCCLEACPNYNGEDGFYGTPIAVSSAKLISQENNENHLKILKDNYNHSFYSGCVKSLACEDICPMKIPTQRAISTMNKKSIWKLWHLIK